MFHTAINPIHTIRIFVPLVFTKEPNTVMTVTEYSRLSAKIRFTFSKIKSIHLLVEQSALPLELGRRLLFALLFKFKEFVTISYSDFSIFEHSWSQTWTVMCRLLLK